LEDQKITIDLERSAATRGIPSIVVLALYYPVLAVGKVNGHLLLLLLAFVGLVIFLALPPGYVSCFFALAIVIVVVRSAFFALIAGIETRHIVECIPGIEMSVAIGLAVLLGPYTCITPCKRTTPPTM
jgi:hypothetical protein